MAGHGTNSTSGEGAVSADFPRNNKYAVMRLIYNLDKGFAFHASLRLEIPDILAKAEADGKTGLSAEEIVEHLPAPRSGEVPRSEIAINLRRLLEPLLEDGMFARSVVDSDRVVYSSTEISRSFAKSNRRNLLGMAGFQSSQPVQKACQFVERTLLDESKPPFDIANGTSVYEYGTKDSEFGTLFANTMTSFNNLELPELLDTLQRSGVLQDVRKLVDVGGGEGTFLAHIIDRNPHIHGINFDQPHVISSPDAVKGVEHIGGSFFESDNIPSGDGIILKMILHNYGDEECSRILRNCYQALPQKGKVLIIEYVLPEIDEQNPKYSIPYGMDFAMLVLFKDGRERRMKEYDALLTAAGFSTSTLISNPDCIAIIQAFKA